MQRFGVLYQGISHECLVFSEYTHDEPSGHAIGNTVAKKNKQIRHIMICKAHDEEGARVNIASSMKQLSLFRLAVFFMAWDKT